MFFFFQFTQTSFHNNNFDWISIQWKRWPNQQLGSTKRWTSTVNGHGQRSGCRFRPHRSPTASPPNWTRPKSQPRPSTQQRRPTLRRARCRWRPRWRRPWRRRRHSRKTSVTLSNILLRRHWPSCTTDAVRSSASNCRRSAARSLRHRPSSAPLYRGCAHDTRAERRWLLTRVRPSWRVRPVSASRSPRPPTQSTPSAISAPRTARFAGCSSRRTLQPRPPSPKRIRTPCRRSGCSLARERRPSFRAVDPTVSFRWMKYLRFDSARHVPRRLFQDSASDSTSKPKLYKKKKMIKKF